MVHLLLVIIYLSFISLGLPDALLGAAWPIMSQEFTVPVSYAGGIALIIAVGTVISSLLSDRLTKWLSSGKVTAISVAMTAVAIFGFSVSREYWQLCLWAIPYGLGANIAYLIMNAYYAGTVLYPDAFADVDMAVKGGEILEAMVGLNSYDAMQNGGLYYGTITIGG